MPSREEIAATVAKELGPQLNAKLGKLYLTGNTRIIWDALISARVELAEREQARNMFWPPNSEREKIIYEIRNGRTQAYVTECVNALLADYSWSGRGLCCLRGECDEHRN